MQSSNPTYWNISKRSVHPAHSSSLVHKSQVSINKWTESTVCTWCPQRGALFGFIYKTLTHTVTWMDSEDTLSETSLVQKA